MRTMLGVMAGVWLFALPAAAQENREYRYLIMFSYQDVGATPESSHTFATFVRTDGTPERNIEAVQTISWLPADLAYTLWSEREQGVNLTYQETLALANERGLRVKRWGPFEIDATLYDTAMRRFEALEAAETSEAIKYKAMDTLTRMQVLQGWPGGAINCIHAVSDLTGFVDTGVRRGDAASVFVLERMRASMVTREEETWLLPRLGL